MGLSDSWLSIESDWRSNARASGQITSNFLTQASWRLCEIRQPPTCLRTTSNVVTNTIVIEMVIMVVMIIMVVMVLSGTSWSTWSPWSSWSSGQTGQPGHTEQRGETSREDRQIWHLNLIFEVTCEWQLLQIDIFYNTNTKKSRGETSHSGLGAWSKDIWGLGVLSIDRQDRLDRLLLVARQYSQFLRCLKSQQCCKIVLSLQIYLFHKGRRAFVSFIFLSPDAIWSSQKVLQVILWYFVVWRQWNPFLDKQIWWSVKLRQNPSKYSKCG